jgi:hypothetical protein
LAIFAVTGVAALSIAACSSSNNSSSTTSPISPSTGVASPTTTSSAPAPPNGESQVRGLIASVAGNAAQVTRQNGNATVDFTGSTKVTEVTPAALTDVATGSCVSVRPQQGGQGGQPITAASVRVSPAVDGKCPQGRESAKRSAVDGAVASVAGNTITVTSSNATQTAVTVTDKTKYTKQGAANTQAISAGKCMTAKGTQDSGGALQATTIDLRPAHDGKCPGEAKPHGHGG